MKKLFTVLALAGSLQVAFAQKPAAEMQKNVDKLNVTSEVGVGTTVEMEVNFQ